MFWSENQDKCHLDICLKHLGSTYFCEFRLVAKFQLSEVVGIDWLWVGGLRVSSFLRKLPPFGFILQAGTCRILNFAQKKCMPGGGTPHIFSEQGANQGCIYYKSIHFFPQPGPTRVDFPPYFLLLCFACILTHSMALNSFRVHLKH